MNTICSSFCSSVFQNVYLTISLFQFRSLVILALSASPILACLGGHGGAGCCSAGYGSSCGPTVPQCISRSPDARYVPEGYASAPVASPIIAGPYNVENAYAGGAIAGPFPAAAAPEAVAAAGAVAPEQYLPQEAAVAQQTQAGVEASADEHSQAGVEASAAEHTAEYHETSENQQQVQEIEPATQEQASQVRDQLPYLVSTRNNVLDNQTSYDCRPPSTSPLLLLTTRNSPLQLPTHSR